MAMSTNEDLFNNLTIEECEEKFAEYCELRIEEFVESKDKLSILRSCVVLLNRLQGTGHNLLAGRVLIFLARVIPLFDRSGVNSISEFSNKELPDTVKRNLHQINEQNAEKDKQKSRSNGVEMEEGETLSDDEDSDDANKQDGTARIYERFWQTQQFLIQPNKLYNKNDWLSFRTAVDTLLVYFEQNPATMKIWQLKDPYMTDMKPFILQLNDINMRRCWSIQILIVLQYLISPVSSRSDHLILDKIQTSWLLTTFKRIQNLLEMTPDTREGRKFAELVGQILDIEKRWNKWKNDKCHEPKRPLEEDEDDFINVASTYSKRKKISDELRSMKQYNMHLIGSREMTKLWNRETSPSIFTSPDLNKYFKIPPEKQAERFKDPNISFKILRLLRKSPHFFVPAAAVIQSIDGYLKSLADKHFQPSTGQLEPSASPNRQVTSSGSTQTVSSTGNCNSL